MEAEVGAPDFPHGDVLAHDVLDDVFVGPVTGCLWRRRHRLYGRRWRLRRCGVLAWRRVRHRGRNDDPTARRVRVVRLLPFP